MLDVSRATLVTAEADRGSRPIRLLLEEVNRRSGVTLRQATAWPARGPVIAVGRAADLSAFAGPWAAALAKEPFSQEREAFRLIVKREGGRPMVLVAGREAPGILFGIGRLLRELEFRPGRLTLPSRLDVATAPRISLRGHGLSFDPRVGCFGRWSLSQWEQYLRDMVVFGANAVSLALPTASPRGESPLSTQEAFLNVGRLAEDYGFKLWVLAPVPATADAVETATLIAGLPRVDGLFLAPSDPRVPPERWIASAEKQAMAFRKARPEAQVFLAPHADEEQGNALGRLMGAGQAWLEGVVYTPQPRLGILEWRRMMPTRLALRYMPDLADPMGPIPIPGWDQALALIYERRAPSIRPRTTIELARPIRYTDGFFTAAAGCQDEVNRIIYTASAWDADVDLVSVLRQYARYLVGAADPDALAETLLALETNWSGPLLGNESVFTTLRRAQALEPEVTTPGPGGSFAGSWRLAMVLYRAYADAYLRTRLLNETALESQALARLSAPDGSTAAALSGVDALLGRAAECPAPAWRRRIAELARAIERDIGLSLPLADEGAPLPALADRTHLQRRLREIRGLDDPRRRAAAAADLLDHRRPSSGAFYDDAGNSGAEPHRIRAGPARRDPGYVPPTLGGFVFAEVGPEAPRAWRDCAMAVDGETVELRYVGLARRARYRVRVVYVGGEHRVRLLADGRLVHGPLATKRRPLDFDLPEAITRDGALALKWFHTAAAGPGDPACQVAEVWLMRR